MNAEQWRSRPTYSRTLTHCNHCEKLKDDVRERHNYWPSVVMTGCQECFDQRVAEVVVAAGRS